MSGIIIFNYSLGNILIVKLSKKEEDIVNSYAFIEEYLSDNWEKIGVNINIEICSWMWVDDIEKLILMMSETKIINL